MVNILNFKYILAALSLSVATKAVAAPPAWVQRLSDLEEIGSEQRNEVACIALVIYYEARGESLKGKTAVGAVVMNRARSGRYPKQICDVVFQRGQFVFLKGAMTPTDKASWRGAVNLAKKIYSGELGDPTGGKLSFYAPKASSKRARGLRIGNHIFH
jgi:spore germination cell wall hydrolase CwlJ-like protein